MIVLGISFIDKIKNIKWNWIKKAVGFIVSVSLVISVLIIVFGTILKLCISIEDKTKYEFVTISSEDFVVLSQYNEKILIVPFEINKNEEYIFKTREYMFANKYDGIYVYRDIKYSPKIDLNV